MPWTVPLDELGRETRAAIGSQRSAGRSHITDRTKDLIVLRDLPLVDLDAWQPTAGEDEWKDHSLQALQRHGASEAHLEAARRDVKLVRVQPEQVAAAATFRALPAALAEIAERAGEIRSELEGHAVR